MPLLPAGTKKFAGRVPNLAEKVQQDLLAAVITSDAPISRTSYSATADVSLPTVQRAANSLLQAGLISQGDDLPIAQRGRPERALLVNPHHVYIGLAIEDRSPAAGTSVGWQVCALGVTLDGRPFHGMAAVTETIQAPHGPGQVIEASRQAVAQVRQKIEESGARVHGLGVSVGGHVDGGTVRFSPNISGLQDQPLDEQLEAATGLHTLIDNDANALARRQLWRKGGRELDFTVVLLKPDGIGSGSVAGGHVHTGARGGGGELGHLKMYPPEELRWRCRCGSDGCLESIATPQAIARRLGLPEIQWREALDKVASGDTRAEQAFSEAGDYLGRGLSHLVAIFDPKKIYLVGVNELVLSAEHPAAHLYVTAALDTLVRDAFPTARIHLRDEGLEGVRVEPEELPTCEEQAVAAVFQHIERLVEGRSNSTGTVESVRSSPKQDRLVR